MHNNEQSEGQADNHADNYADEQSDKQANRQINDPADNDEGLTLIQLIGSALAAGFGVQSSQNRKRDFAKGKPSQFIAIGIIFTVLFVLIMVGVVNLVLNAVAAQ